MLVPLLTSRPPFASTATSIRRASIANPSSELPNQEAKVTGYKKEPGLISRGRRCSNTLELPHCGWLYSMFIQATLPQLHPALLRLQVQAIYAKPNIPKTPSSAFSSCSRSLQTGARGVCYGTRRRVRYEDGKDEDEEYGHNEEIAILESYSESAWSKALLVRATVDAEEEEVLIFRGFSSCLSSRTATDPSKSVLPAKAIIKSIDVIKGPFDPSHVEYLEKDLTWESFKARLQVNQF